METQWAGNDLRRSATRKDFLAVPAPLVHPVPHQLLERLGTERSRPLVSALVAQPASRDDVLRAIFSPVASCLKVFGRALQGTGLFSTDAMARSKCFQLMRLSHDELAVIATPMLVRKCSQAKSNESFHGDHSGEERAATCAFWRQVRTVFVTGGLP